MKLSRTIAAAILVTGTASAAFALNFDEPADAPFAISLGVTFSQGGMPTMGIASITEPSMGGISLDTLSASVATGGSTAVSNATAAVTDGTSATSSNGGATMPGQNGMQSEVKIGDGAFISGVGTGIGHDDRIN